MTFQPEGITSTQAADLHTRREKWDPYWNVTQYIACGRTTLLTGFTGATVGCDPIKKGMVFKWWGKVDAPGITEWCKPTPQEYRNGQTRLILHMIPLKHEYKKKADGHLFPLGCLLTIDGQKIPLRLRKQQEHDLTEWKGLCEPVDVTSYISNPKAGAEFCIFSCDDKPYYFCLAACKYQRPGAIFTNLMKDDSILHVLTREEGIQKALTHAIPAISVDSDDDDDEQDSIGQFPFSLTCPFSGMIMEKPVRGKYCTHFQCFDLLNFLTGSSRISGTRWRCVGSSVCHNFLSIDDLELCGFTADLLVEMKGQLEPKSKDRIQFCSDRTYRLIEEKPKKQRKKRAREDASSQSKDIVVLEID